MDRNKIMKTVEVQRKKIGMSKAELANKAGITDRALYMWESGKRGMTLHSASMLLSAVGLELEIRKKEEAV